MSDVQLLFVVLAVLYGWECLCWLRRGSVAFTTWLGHYWRLQHPAALAGNQNGGFILAPALPPLGTLWIANQYPLSLSPAGVLAFVATNMNPGWRPLQSGRFVCWTELREARARGKKIWVNGELLVTAATPGMARCLTIELKKLGQLPFAGRAPAIAQLVKSSLDTQAIEARRTEWQKRARPVCWLANLLVVYVFVIAPGLIWLFGFLLCWLGLLLGLLGLTVTTAIVFACAHRVLYPQAEDERFTHTLTITLAPTSAMRARDTLSRPLVEMFHPLAVAKACLREDAFHDFARRILLDLRHPALPRCPNEQPEAIETELFFRQTQLAATEDFLKWHSIKLPELCRAPRPGDESSQAYCPRCEAQFTTAEGRCSDCGGLALVAFTRAKG